MYAALSLDPSISEYYESFIGLGPVIFADHISSPFFKLFIEIHGEVLWLLLKDPNFMDISFE